MSKIAEQKALEKYQDVTLEECHGDIKMMHYYNDNNFSLRYGYIEGYDQGFQDFMEKAVSFIRNCTTYDGLGYKAKCVNIEKFINYMKNE